MNIPNEITKAILDIYDSSYSNVKRAALKLVKSGFSPIDIVIKLNEDFDHDMVKLVIGDLRQQGLI